MLRLDHGRGVNMAEVSKVTELIGLGAPLLYGAAAYFVFHFLDERASAEAKAALSAWLKPVDYDGKPSN